MSEIKEITLKVMPENLKLFKLFVEAIGNSSDSETFEKMIHLMYAAISISTRENPVVNLYTRDPKKIVNSQVDCPSCGNKFLPTARECSDGFKETSIKLL